MSATELKELRKGVKKYLDQADERVVRMVYAMLDADQDAQKHSSSQSGLTHEQEAIVLQRLEKYKKGAMKFSTWEDVEKRITSKAKNAI